VSQTTELERIETLVSGETPPPVAVRVVAEVVGGDPAASLERVKQVMRVVAEKRGDKWPSDSWWRANLPNWLLDSFEGHTDEELLRNPALWDFESWLDAMKNPGWIWWSSAVEDSGWRISLCAFTDPFSIGALEYLARVAGGGTISIEE